MPVFVGIDAYSTSRSTTSNVLYEAKHHSRLRRSIEGTPVTRFDDLPDVLTPGEVQSFLRLGRNATYALLQNGTLRSVRLGQKYLIPREAVRELLEGGGEPSGTGTPMKGHA